MSLIFAKINCRPSIPFTTSKINKRPFVRSYLQFSMNFCSNKAEKFRSLRLFQKSVSAPKLWTCSTFLFNILCILAAGLRVYIFLSTTKRRQAFLVNSENISYSKNMVGRVLVKKSITLCRKDIVA